jgi:hypothetical protein
MPVRTSDALTTIAAILTIGAVLVTCIFCGIDETVAKIGIGTIAALGGFAARGLTSRQ